MTFVVANEKHGNFSFFLCKKNPQEQIKKDMLTRRVGRYLNGDETF